MIQKHFVTSKQFIMSVLVIAIPISLQNMISFGVNMMDMLMLGELGDVAISAASLGGKFFFFLTIIGFGLTSGGSVLIAQYWGKGDLKKIRKLFAISLQIVTTVSIIFALTSYFFPHLVLGLFTSETVIIEAGIKYLKILSLSYFFYSFSNCFMMSLRAVENVKLSTIVYGISFCINVFFNYCFIFGKLGFKEYGIQVAAMGTLIARMSEFLMVMFYMNFKEKVVKFNLKSLLKYHSDLISDYIKYSLPVVGNELVWGMGSLCFTMIIGRMGTAFVAANTIADLLNQIASVALFGVGNAAAILTGKTIGQGNQPLAQRMANSLLVMTLILSSIGATFMLLSKGFVIGFFGGLSGEAAVLADTFITTFALLQIPIAYSIVTIIGILRGGGDIKFAFLIDCGAMWVLAIPFGILSAFVFKAPPFIIYVVLRIDCVLKTIAGIHRTVTGKWIRNVTRD